MSPVQKAGLYYPNKFGLITIKSLEEVMGKNGLNAILNLAGMNNYIDNYPADNLDKGFDFGELSAIGSALNSATKLMVSAYQLATSGQQPSLDAQRNTNFRCLAKTSRSAAEVSSCNTWSSW